MSHPATLRSLLLAGACAALLPACDVEPDSATDYDVVAHVDLARLQKASWVAKALEGGNTVIKLHPDGKSTLKSCTELLKQADAFTVGTGNDRIELYVEGALDRSGRDKCFAELKSTWKSKEKVRTAVLGDDLVAVIIGADPLPAPSRARMKDLLDAEPSNSGNEAAWFTMQNGPADEDVRYAEGWANVDKGLDAHFHVEMKDQAKAAELNAEVSAVLLAMKLSSETSDLAKAVKVSASGDTITADVRASDKQMRKMITTMNASGGADDKGATITIEAK